MSKRFDVVGLGNAMVDVLSHEEESFLTDHGIEKHAMNKRVAPVVVDARKLTTKNKIFLINSTSS